MFNHISADGYFAGPEGGLDWVVPEDGVARTALENMPGSGAMLFGRKTYEMFEAYWPHALDDSDTAEDPHEAGRRSSAVRDMAVWINESEKIVFSRTRTSYPWKNSRGMGELDPQEVANLKGETGGDIMLFGSGSIVGALSKHGLIDEYQFVVSPVLLGEGRTMLHDASARSRLRLIEARPFESGVVLMRYGPA